MGTLTVITGFTREKKLCCVKCKIRLQNLGGWVGVCMVKFSRDHTMEAVTTGN